MPEPVSKAPKPAADPAELGEWWGDTPGVWDTPGETYLRSRRLWPDDDESVWERWEIRVSKVARWADRDAVTALRTIPGVSLPDLRSEFAGAMAYIQHSPETPAGEWYPPISGFHLDGIRPDGTHPPLHEDRWRRNAGPLGNTTVALTTDITRPCLVTEGVTDLLAVLALRSIGEVLKVAQKPLPVPCGEPLSEALGAGEVRSVNGVARLTVKNLDPHLPNVIVPDRDDTGKSHARSCVSAALGEGRKVRMWRWWQHTSPDAGDLCDALAEWWTDLTTALEAAP